MGKENVDPKKSLEKIRIEAEPNLPVFMGVCESALVRGDGVLQDFYGAGDLLLLPFFPQRLGGIYLLIGFPSKTVRPFSLIVRDKKHSQNEAQLTIEQVITKPADGKASVLGFTKPYCVARSEESSEAPKTQLGTPLLIRPNLVYKLLPMPCPPLFVTEPTEVQVIAKVDEQESEIGSFGVVFVETPPISEEERVAIMSRPGAISGVAYDIRCNKCKDGVRFRLPLKEGAEPPDEMRDSVLLTTGPEKWECKCGGTKIPLTYLKKGFHNIFRRVSMSREPEGLTFVPLYQRGAIAAIVSKYQKLLIEQKNKEEAVQKFIECNPILWNFLSPQQIWKKPPILTKYNADFAVLNTSRILYFIEIEKPSTKLVKQDGGVCSELQAGLDQIRDWRTEIDKRREAVLDGLGLTQKDVHDIRYILVAGLASKTPADGLEKTRRMKTEADSIFCFDELAFFLHSTETALLNI